MHICEADSCMANLIVVFWSNDVWIITFYNHISVLNVLSMTVILILPYQSRSIAFKIVIFTTQYIYVGTQKHFLLGKIKFNNLYTKSTYDINSSMNPQDITQSAS